MSSKLKMIEPVVAELSIRVPKEDVTNAMNRAYGMVRRSAKISGFRPGKVPMAVVKRMYAKAVRADVQSELMRNHLFLAIQEHDLDPLSELDFKEAVIEENADFDFKVTFEVAPTLKEINYKDIEVVRNPVSVKPEAVDAELEKLRASLAAVSDLAEPRPAAKGDVAMVSLKRWLDGNWEEGGLPDQEVIIGDGQAPKQIDDALVGMSVDEEKVVDLGAEDALEENRMRYLVRVTALKERILPALDDELAKDAGEYENLAALRAHIEERMLDIETRSEDQRVRMAVLDALRQKNTMTLPPSLLKRHTETIKQQYFGQIAAQLKADDEKDMETLGKLDESAEKTAGEMVHQHLLMKEIARRENITVSDDDIEAEIERLGTESGIPLPLFKAEMGKEGRRDDLKQRLMETKIFDFVKSLVTIKERDPSDAGDGDKKSGAKSAPKKKATEKTAAKKEPTTAKKAEAEKAPEKKTATKKTAAKKETTKKTAAKKDTAKKTATKKTAAKKDTKKKTAAKKPAAKKSAAKKS